MNLMWEFFLRGVVIVGVHYKKTLFGVLIAIVFSKTLDAGYKAPAVYINKNRPFFFIVYIIKVAY